MNKQILKTVMMLMFAVSIVTLGAPSQIARSSQPIKEATEQMYNSLESEANSKSEQIPEVLERPDASNHDIEETESAEPTTVSDSNPEIFDPLQADMNDLWFAVDTSSGAIVIAKSIPTEAAQKEVIEDEYPAPNLRALIYKIGEIEIDVSSTGFRGIPGVSVGSIESFNEGCLTEAFSKNSSCELKSNVNGLKTIVEFSEVKTEDGSPLEWPFSKIMIRASDASAQDAVTLYSSQMSKPVDINRDGYPDFWESRQVHASGATEFSLHYSVTEGKKLIRYDFVFYTVPGC
jgi:hypothetical protein